MTTKQSRNVMPVVEGGLCTGCGTCEAVCPRYAITLVIDGRKGVYLPRLDRGRCTDCGLCLATCPGQSVNFREFNQRIFGKQPEDLQIGNYLGCYVGYAADHQVRYDAASGGVVTSLLIHAIEKGLIHGALVTGMRHDAPLRPNPIIARTSDEIISASRSKYCPVPANIALRQIRDAPDDQKFAVVGLPCHLHGIRKIESVDRRIREKLVLHIGLFCSHPMTFWGTEFLLRKYNVNREDVVSLDYRGSGWPGCMKIRMRNGSRMVIPLHEYIIYHDLGCFTPWRCTLCCDHLNELADISVGDPWLPEQRCDNIGSSTIICRSQIGENILRSAVDEEQIAVRDLDTKRVRLMNTKKLSFVVASRIAKLLGRRLPSYDMALGGETDQLATYPLFVYLYALPLSILLYPHMMLSRLEFWPLMKSLVAAEHAFMNAGTRTVRLVKLK